MENLKKFTLRDWVLMALALALMIVVGRLLYSISFDPTYSFIKSACYSTSLCLLER